jgi:hypothetical protein
MPDKIEKEYDLKAAFSQDKDCVGGKEDFQFLEIETADGGGGPFFVMKTKRWAFDKPEEVYNLLKEFEEKFKKIKNEGVTN